MSPRKKINENPTGQSGSEIIIYQTESGQTRLEVRLQDESVWLTQQLMADLFRTSVQNISAHIANIYEEGVLTKESTLKKFLTVQPEGTREVRRERDYYNLDMIISVGYRVKSHIATRFRQWATLRLKEYVIKGFVLDDDRLKNPDHPLDYYDELLQRIQDIRTSERRFYQKITDIYATSVDYDPTTDMSIEFFKTVQNKMHWAITGKTAAEIIHDRANSAKPNMGLTFVLSTKNWIEKTNAIGVVAKTGRYGGTYAQKDITFEFASWISVLRNNVKRNIQ